MKQLLRIRLNAEAHKDICDSIAHLSNRTKNDLVIEALRYFLKNKHRYLVEAVSGNPETCTEVSKTEKGADEAVPKGYTQFL